MRKLTISECQQLEKGEPIPSFQGLITKVYEHKTGVGEYGPWALQNMTVEDDTGKVQVTMSSEDDLSELEGQVRLFECSQSDKYGLTGIKWDVRTSNGKTYSGIKLTNSCKIKPVNGSDVATENTSPVNNAPTSNPKGASSDRSHRIERQHSQEMALRSIVIREEEASEANIRTWTDWFQLDLDNLPAPPVHNDIEATTGTQSIESESPW